MQRAIGPLPFDERYLFGERLTWSQRTGRLALLVIGFSILTAALTWLQVRYLDSVPDLGDPLFSIWRIAWVSHQIVHDPLQLFDENMFYPERLTLAYSDSIIVPSLISTPLFWMGLHPVLIYNLLLLSGFVLSGVTMFPLVRALTDRIDAALIVGAIFTLYSYRLEHYPHLELQVTMWIPLTLLALHRTMAGGWLRDGLATGLIFALQMLSSPTTACFSPSIWRGGLWPARGGPRHPLVALAVLADYGVERLLGRWPRYRTATTAVLLGLIMFEAMPRMPLEPVWYTPPPI